ncbi:Hypothetical_protein [Hexamita inflata]|uniref:Hypothetical_protein n=1 Tax=Hexamita inflata TaxID=28002 RepID=A0AA86V260_9EUKA|nr:Hypothetical protein HINF_LOCUS61021 [Hexamita inflata]
MLGCKFLLAELSSFILFLALCRVSNIPPGNLSWLPWQILGCLVVCCLGRCAGLAGWAVGAGWGVRAWCVLCGLPGGVLCLGYFLFLAFHFSLFFLPGFETDARFGGAWVGFWQGSLGFGSREVTF